MFAEAHSFAKNVNEWGTRRDTFSFRYWEEDFLGYLDVLWQRNDHAEIEWVMQHAGNHKRRVPHSSRTLR